MKNPPALEIVNRDEMSLLGLMLGGILRHNLDCDEGAARASKMNGRLGVIAGRMSLTIGFEPGIVSVTKGLCEPLDAMVKGSLGGLMRIALGQGPVRSFLAGEVTVRGNPFFALRAMPLFKVRGPREGDI